MMQAPSVSATPAPRGYPIFMDAGLFSAFNLKRGLYYLLVPLPVLAISACLGQGLPGLALAVIAFWPFHFRCYAERQGLRITWLIVNERVRWEEIIAIKLEADRRRWVIGRRALVLVVERRSRPRMVLRGRPEVLSRLAADMER